MKKNKKQLSFRNLIWVSFTMASVCAILLLGGTFYTMFSGEMRSRAFEEKQQIMSQINSSITTCLRSVMKVSDTVCYSIVREQDVEETDLAREFQLLYDANNNIVKNITLFDERGNMIATAPAAILKEQVYPQKQSWFQKAVEKTENMHFSNPHIQNLFVEQDQKYERVISLSRSVLIVEGDEVKNGVLLIDILYSGFKQAVNNIKIGKDGYVYIMDRDGQLIYHPHETILEEEEKAQCFERVLQQNETEDEGVLVKTIGYTGWLMVGITGEDSQLLGTAKAKLLVLLVLLAFSTMLVILNSNVSERVSKPFQKLEDSLQEIESGNLDVKINVSGTYEIQHMSKIIQKMSAQLKKLMEDVVREHEEKRKSELETLQSQINPHFLYNTLDIIVWMIENKCQEEAAMAVTALARFFRISLSKGKSIIPVRSEIEHVSNYLIIQKMRYKNRFEYTIDMDEDVKELLTIKLVLQPLVENAIYHGLEYVDGDGQIQIRAYRRGDDLYLSVKDNGLGMPQEMIDGLLKGEIKSSSSGSGIGVSNVNQRIQLHFGKEYGLIIHSELDEGTEMIVHLPAREHFSDKE